MRVYILLQTLRYINSVINVYTDKAAADAEAARLKSLYDQYFYVIERELQ
jgi:hypothetical protein